MSPVGVEDLGRAGAATDVISESRQRAGLVGAEGLDGGLDGGMVIAATGALGC